MSSNRGFPSYVTDVVASRDTAAVCGMLASKTASFASSVPDTQTRTCPTSESSGMAANASGSSFAAMKLHGPSNPSPANHRPRKKHEVPLGRDLHEHVALGVADVEKLAADRFVVGGALGDDELRRLGRDDDRRWRR